MKIVIIVLFLLKIALGMISTPFKVYEVNKNTLWSGARPRIFAGREAVDGEFKFMVFALINGDNIGDNMSRCTASLIRPEWVLLAAHCINYPELRSEDILLVGGKADLLKYVRNKLEFGFRSRIPKEITGAQERYAKNFYIHPEYNDTTYHHDLALIRLYKPFNDSLISSISLSTGKIEKRKTCTILGWGLTGVETDGEDFKLRFLKNKIASTKLCQYSKKDVICLLPESRGICMGDSGGPLVCDGKVWGVASHFMSNYTTCGYSSEDFYAEIHPDLEWINSICDNSGQTLNKIFSIKIVLIYFSFTLWILS